MISKELQRITGLLATELTKPLPGKAAQLRMAPFPRRPAEFAAPVRQAAVLILLFPSGDNIFICLIRRAEYEGVHSGQISFPGGMAEISDSGLEDTAKRETSEETGVDSGKITILGKLTPLPVPVSSFMVHPFVGFLDEHPEFVPDPIEVSFIIEAPLKVLLDPGAVKKEKWNLTNESAMVPFYISEGHRIWGATAMILSEFLEIISRAEPAHSNR